MRLTEYQKFIGKFGTVVLAGMQVVVEIIDIQESYGSVKATITPALGTGRVNVLLDRVRIEGERICQQQTQ